MIIQEPEELEAELNRGRIEPVYLISGEEKCLCDQALRALKKKLLSPDMMAFNYAEFSAAANSAEEILAAVSTFPMMATRRVVVVADVESLASDAGEKLKKYIQNPSSRSVLILLANEIDRRTSFYRLIKEKACVADFPKLKSAELERRAEILVRRHSLQMSAASLKKLVEMSGSDLGTLINEVEKLSLYCGNGNTVPDSVVDEIASRSRQHGIFELTDALARRDRGAALKHLASLIDSGEEPIMILGMMARHFRQVLIVKELMEKGEDKKNMAAAAQIHPYFLEGFLQNARCSDTDTARRIYQKLAATDFRFKSTRTDKKTLLESLILSL